MIVCIQRLVWTGCVSLCCIAIGCVAEPRREISLDGTWQVAEGVMDQPPAAFKHTAPVPGLLDMATPPFESPGSTLDLEQRLKPWLRLADSRREAFWYRRTFKLNGALPEVARLKINKARFGVKVILNGHELGEHAPNFTPGWFDARPCLKADGTTNELLVRVGASLAQVPAYINDGWDNEKSRYIPGIYDSVQLFLSGAPHVVNVQTMPDVERRAVRAVVQFDRDTTGPIRGSVHEVHSGRVVGETTVQVRDSDKADITVALRNARFWTPEDPFLYELVVDTGGDVSRTRFGLRTFAADPASGRVLLNDRPYFLRGSNVCIFRFFEDTTRGNLPWDRSWVRTLFRRFKAMHWNSLRFCIGFPPEFWYQIADEEGILIQDEFPIWYARAKDGWPQAITPEHLSVEYTEWMRERWNHPCVVIWDAQNETSNDKVIAAAIGAVRSLDLSNRPWDNGWGGTQSPHDISEMHPYRSTPWRLKGKPFTLNIFAQETGVPDNGPRRDPHPPYIINEYGWLWINRDGSLPTLTRDIYKWTLGENATVEQRLNYYARTLAAKTEFWRSRRKCAGVLHFCGLGYSRPDGQTSDHWIDVKNLIFEPHFQRYVGDAFAPVGVTLDFWNESMTPGEKRTMNVIGINDLYADWTGVVRLRLKRGEQVVLDVKKSLTIPALGKTTRSFEIVAPTQEGDYTWEATLMADDQPSVHSLRDVQIIPSERKAATP